MLAKLVCYTWLGIVNGNYKKLIPQTWFSPGLAKTLTRDKGNLYVQVSLGLSCTSQNPIPY